MKSCRTIHNGSLQTDQQRCEINHLSYHTHRIRCLLLSVYLNSHKGNEQSQAHGRDSPLALTLGCTQRGVGGTPVTELGRLPVRALTVLPICPRARPLTGSFHQRPHKRVWSCARLIHPCLQRALTHIRTDSIGLLWLTHQVTCPRPKPP